MTTPMLTKAINLAKRNPIDKLPRKDRLPRMAAIIVTKDGREYVGFNSKKTHPLMAKFGKNEKAICLHAEVDAIRQSVRCKAELAGSTMYIARVDRKGLPRLAKPCIGCRRAIISFGIREVEWTE